MSMEGFPKPAPVEKAADDAVELTPEQPEAVAEKVPANTIEPVPSAAELTPETTEETPEQIEAAIEIEKANLEANVEVVGANLEKLEASSPDRLAKVLNFMDKNWATVLGGSTALVYEVSENVLPALFSGSDINWGKVAIGLNLALLAGGALDSVVRKGIKLWREKRESKEVEAEA